MADEQVADDEVADDEVADDEVADEKEETTSERCYNFLTVGNGEPTRIYATQLDEPTSYTDDKFYTLKSNDEVIAKFRADLVVGWWVAE